MILYNLVIHFFYLGLRIAALFKPKAKLWVTGRNKWELELQKAVEKFELKDAIWMHCASLGEFEQGRPLLQKIRNENAAQKIILTFFSPSGYEIQKQQFRRCVHDRHVYAHACDGEHGLRGLYGLCGRSGHRSHELALHL